MNFQYQPVENLSWQEFKEQYYARQILVMYGNGDAINASIAGICRPRSCRYFCSAIIVIIASVAFSFLYFWWLFIPGLLMSLHLFNMAKNENIRAFREAIFLNEDAYIMALKHQWIGIYRNPMY